MLTDPFYADKPAYSDGYTGIQYINAATGTDAITLLQAMKGTLESAGWEELPAARVRSTAHLETVAAMMPVVTPPSMPTLPVVMLDACTRFILPQQVQATITSSSGPVNYVAYDPFVWLDPGICQDRIWYPAGTTIEDTAANLAAKISETTGFNVTFTGIREDPSMPVMGRRMQFFWETRPPFTWENDFYQLSMAGGSRFTSQGSYLLRSQTSENGHYMTAKLQTVAMTVFGIEEDATFGGLTPFITIESSGGGTFQHAVYASGDYLMAASGLQFVIWCDRTGRAGSAMLASIPKMDNGHFAGADPVVCAGSESYSWFGWTNDFQHLTSNLHWEHSFASGYNGTLKDMGFRTQATDGIWRDPTMLNRGLRAGVPLLTLWNVPLIQSAYVLLSDEPNKTTDEDRIGGRLWDMMISSSNTGMAVAGGESGRYDGKTWRALSVSTKTEDVTSSMWVRE